jgi:hypothetical protein
MVKDAPISNKQQCYAQCIAVQCYVQMLICNKSLIFFQVKFHALRGPGQEGYVAINDVSFTGSSNDCTVLPPEAVPSLTTLMPSTIPTTPHLPFQESCGFEEDFCNFKPSSEELTWWNRKRGADLTDGSNLPDTNPHGDANSSFH